MAGAALTVSVTAEEAMLLPAVITHWNESPLIAVVTAFTESVAVVLPLYGELSLRLVQVVPLLGRRCHW